MKNRIILLVAMLLVTIANTFANQAPADQSRLLVNIEKAVEANCINLRLANLEKKGALIELRDPSGKVWFSQYVWRKHGFAKKLKLKGLPEGGYLLTVQHEEATVIQALHLSVGGVSLEKHQRLVLANSPTQELVDGK